MSNVRTRKCGICDQSTTLATVCGECWMGFTRLRRRNWVRFMAKNIRPLKCVFQVCRHQDCMCSQLRCAHHRCEACGIGHGRIVVTGQYCESCASWIAKHGLPLEEEEAA